MEVDLRAALALVKKDKQALSVDLDKAKRARTTAERKAAALVKEVAALKAELTRAIQSLDSDLRPKLTVIQCVRSMPPAQLTALVTDALLPCPPSDRRGFQRLGVDKI